jgi:enediyne biosynthesis protein E4
MRSVSSASLIRCALALAAFLGLLIAARDALPIDALSFTFEDVTVSAGIRTITYAGAEGRNRLLVETTGCGAAFVDYDDDGWLDVFLVNGWRFEGFTGQDPPTNRLYRNNRDGTFADVTARSGLAHSGWGQAVCAGDYDNDGRVDLFVTYWGQSRLFRNAGDGIFQDVTGPSGLIADRSRWNSGCAFLDYDRDGDLDLFVATYLLDPEKAPSPEAGPCLYKGMTVACGPSGLGGDRNVLYRNDGKGLFTDVSAPAGIVDTTGRYGLGVLVLDFDDDGWPDVYVANDSMPSALYRNNRNGTFTDIAVEAGCAFNVEGKAQAGMGVAAGDYDGDGHLDIFKTNFSGDTSTLYRNVGGKACEDVTFQTGLGRNTRWLGWGVGFLDPDRDGWLDVLLVNGHVYPEVDRLGGEVGYAQPKVVYRNAGNGRFEDVSALAGAAIRHAMPARGAAFGDYDNDGDVDVLVNAMNASPQLLRSDTRAAGHWLTIRAIGTRSNRSGIGARVRVVAGGRQFVDEVRSGGSYFSQGDLRVHVGLGTASRADRIEIRWPSGIVDTLTNVQGDRAIVIREGEGIVERAKAGASEAPALHVDRTSVP